MALRRAVAALTKLRTLGELLAEEATAYLGLDDDDPDRLDRAERSRDGPWTADRGPRSTPTPAVRRLRSAVRRPDTTIKANPRRADVARPSRSSPFHPQQPCCPKAPPPGASPRRPRLALGFPRQARLGPCAPGFAPPARIPGRASFVREGAFERRGPSRRRKRFLPARVLPLPPFPRPCPTT
jgi:hypothetical protein